MNRLRRPVLGFARVSATVCAFSLTTSGIYGSPGDAPAWWTDFSGGIFDGPAESPANWAPANVGQLKHVAVQAKRYLDETFAQGGGSGTAVSNICQFQSSGNTGPLNLGQLKNVAKPFYDRLAELHFNWRTGLSGVASPLYPWVTVIGPENATPVNLGQLKNVFSFEITDTYLQTDVDADGLLDWWEFARFSNLTSGTAATDLDTDGLTNLGEFQTGANPNAQDTDGDGLGDNVDAKPTIYNPPTVTLQQRGKNTELYQCTYPGGNSWLVKRTTSNGTPPDPWDPPAETLGAYPREDYAREGLSYRQYSAWATAAPVEYASRFIYQTTIGQPGYTGHYKIQLYPRELRLTSDRACSRAQSRTFLLVERRRETTTNISFTNEPWMVENVTPVTLTIQPGQQVSSPTPPPTKENIHPQTGNWEEPPTPHDRSAVERQWAFFELGFNGLWETKNKANRIFNATRKDDGDLGAAAALGLAYDEIGQETYIVHREMLYVTTDPVDSKFHVSLNLTVPDEFRPQFRCAVYASNTKTIGSDTALPASASQPANIVFPATYSPAGSYRYVVKAGFDANGNSQLDDVEASELRVYEHPTHGAQYARIMGISSDHYSESLDEVDDLLDSWFVQRGAPNAKAALLLFRDGNILQIANSLRPDVSRTATMDAFADATGFSEWLTHNCGAPFSDAGVATIGEYVWNKDSSWCNSLLLGASPFGSDTTGTNAAWKAIWRYCVDEVAPLAAAYLADKPVGTHVTFPQPEDATDFYEIPIPYGATKFSTPFPKQPSWVPSRTVVVGKPVPESIPWSSWQRPDDAFVSTGRARMFPVFCTFTLSKFNDGTVRVKELRLISAYEDLWDFGFERTGPSHYSAVLQIGFGNGSYGSTRTAGQIYRSRFEFDRIYQYTGVIVWGI